MQNVYENLFLNGASTMKWAILIDLFNDISTPYGLFNVEI